MLDESKIGTMTKLKAVGSLHFGAPDKSSPFCSLVKELDKMQGLEDSLLVLPEGFNVPDGYYGGTGPTPSIKNKLLSLSEERKIAFVAGLIEERPNPNSPLGYNSACLIDAACEDKFRLLSQKRTGCFGRIDADNPRFISKPIEHRGFGIAALVCQDFISCDLAARTTLIEHPEWMHCDAKILCVPACSTHKQLKTASEPWAQEVCIAASNGGSEDISFVRGNGFETNEISPDCRSGIPQDNGWRDDWGYQYNQILLSRKEPVGTCS
jgi:hypothetical protein